MLLIFTTFVDGTMNRNLATKGSPMPLLGLSFEGETTTKSGDKKSFNVIASYYL
jgi:hypothetical protein